MGDAADAPLDFPSSLADLLELALRIGTGALGLNCFDGGIEAIFYIPDAIPTNIISLASIFWTAVASQPLAHEIQSKLAQLASRDRRHGTGSRAPIPFASFEIAGSTINFGASLIGNAHLPGEGDWSATLFPDVAAAREGVAMDVNPDDRRAWLLARREARQVAEGLRRWPGEASKPSRI